jgi:CMP-N-acetylneuraminate monooxygenase
LWNDSILLIEIESFKILNTNDAGINQKIKNLVGDIDLLMVGFSTTASGFPATWDHISDEQKSLYYSNAVNGVYKMLENSLRIYNAKYLLPFASFTTLLDPRHQKFVNLSESTNVDKINDYFKDSEYEIINLLPGEKWNSKSNKFERVYTTPQRKKLYDKKNKISFALNYFDKSFKNNPKLNTLSKDQAIIYFLKFNNIPEVIFCEDLKFGINVLNKFEGDVKYSITCVFEKGVLSISEEIKSLDVEMWIPEDIFSIVITQNLSWDEAHIGYWCRFTRKPDVFHQNFWRLLQTPYYVKENSVNFSKKKKVVSRFTNIAEIISKNSLNELILRRYGMYCTICNKGFAENIESGAKAHGLNETEIDKLIEELNFIN